MNIAICDDEKVILKSLKEKTEMLFPEAAVKTYLSGETLLAEKQTPDIVLLDIRMQGMNGMDTAGKLRNQKADTIIIFVTAAPEYLAYEFVYFVQKSIS